MTEAEAYELINIYSEFVNNKIEQMSENYYWSISNFMLSDEMKGIIRMWKRKSKQTAEKNKLEAFRIIVTHELKSRLINILLNFNDIGLGQYRITNEEDLLTALNYAQSEIYLSNWNIKDKLLTMAKKIIARDGDTLLWCDLLPFYWYDPESKDFHYSQDYTDIPPNNAGISCLFKKSIQVFYNYEEYDKNVCSICIDSESKSSIFAKTECNHTFHRECLYKWISTSLTSKCISSSCYVIISCPNCRTNMYKGFNDV